MIRIAHLADLHFRRDRVQEIKIALDALNDQIVERHGVDLIIIAGDIWDGAIQNTEGSEFNFFRNQIARLADRAPVVMIYGTPSHDIEGSLQVFEDMETEHGVTILRPSRPYFLNLVDHDIYAEESAGTGVLIFGIPEPNTKWLMAGAQAEGKEAAAATAASALQTLCLGLGATRQQHPNLPCITLYHGRVRGASFASGQDVEDGIPAGDLASIGADYYALGDIHLPQQIPGLPAYYPGSLYACNWGEEHKPGWNLVHLPAVPKGAAEQDLFVDVPPEGVQVERIEFPLPQQKKVTCRAADKKPVDVFRGFKGWLEITATPAEAAEINPDELLRLMREYGAVDGSRVTFNIIPVETVRAAEITDLTSLADKVKLWSDASDIEYTEELASKAARIEEEARAQGVVTASSHIRLDRLILRGSIGIWKGQRKEEVELNLREFQDGLIALVGVNGAGKTTLIENLHPWPQMLTRSGKLQDQFMLKDSFRDLYFTDERTGTEYRALLLIDGKNKSGSVEYHLQQRTPRGYEPISDINGRQAPYLAKIDELFGSLPLFLKSAFISQRPSKANPDLSDTTNSEKKELFAELAGIDYLAEYAELANARVKDGETGVARAEATLDAINSQLEQLPELRTKIETGETFVKDLGNRKAELDIKVRDTSSALEKATSDRQKAYQIAEKLGNLRTQASDVDQQLDDTNANITEYQKAAADRASAESQISEHKKLEKQLADLKEKRAKVDQEYHQKYQTWSTENQIIQDKRSALKDQIAELEKLDAAAMAEFKASGNQRVQTLAKLAELDNEKTCPTCGQDLPASSIQKIDTQKRMLQASIQQNVSEEKELAEKHRGYQEQISKLTSDLSLVSAPDAPVKLDTTNLDNQIRNTDQDLAFSDLAGAEATLQKAQEAAVRIQELEKQIGILEARKKDLYSSIDELKSDFDPDAEQKFTAAKEVHDQVITDLNSTKNRIAAGEARLEELRSQVASLEEKEKEIAQRLQDLTALKLDIEDWKILQRACGRDGIQALELDALAPSIAETANRILASAYGSQFQIEFRTTRMAGSGSREKQVETFDIIIHDSEDGTEQALETLSGGESVWIKKAIYDAFGIIRARNTGIKFLTAIQDEADGALDPSAKERYFRMLEAAHNESGRHQTIIITHSREIQEMIQQTIDISALASAPALEPVA
jgi:exonuclease SbcC